MGEATAIDFSRWIDVGAKALTAIAIPIATLVIESSIRAQTGAIEQQGRAFEQSLKKQEKNVDLTLKFYEVIGSKRFECYDESKGPLLKVFLDTNNKYNDVQIPYEDVAGSLTKTSLTDPSCTKVAEDTEAAKKSNNGELPIVAASGDPAAVQKNEQAKAAIAAAATSLHKTTAHPEDAPGDGWVAVGRHHGNTDTKERHSTKLDFSNFSVVGGQSNQSKLELGMIIKTKVAVYLRYSSDDTGLGRNHILAVLSRGTCAVVKRTIPDLRSQTWARVDIQPSCAPEEDSNQRAALRTGDG
jgi:hypothetical protein